MLARMIVIVVSLAGFLPGPAAHAAPALAPQSSNAGGVSVAVTPLPVSADGRTAFEITLDSHSSDLSEDLQKSAVLVTGDGKVHTPVAWKGAAPGGHHRKGVLTFAPIAPQPQSIELKLQRPGEAVPRIFRWTVR